MLDYKRIKELNDKYYYSESKKAYIDKSTKSAIDLSEAERMEYECAKYLSSVLFQTMKDKKMDVYSLNLDNENEIQNMLNNIYSSFEDSLNKGSYKEPFLGVVFDVNENKSTKIPSEVSNFWNGILEENSSSYSHAMDAFRHMLISKGRELKSYESKVVNNEPTRTLFFETEEYVSKKESKLNKLKSYKPEDYEKGEYLNLTPEQSKKRMGFVDSLIASYDATETPEEYKQRSEERMADAQRIVEAIRDNYFAGNRTVDINGHMEYDDNGNQYKCYSPNEIKKMVQMLKTAKAMSDKTGEDYLEAFLNQPNVNLILHTMREDKNGYLKELKDRANENIKADNAPKYPDDSSYITYDRIIDEALQPTRDEHIIEEPEEQGFLGKLRALVEENPTFDDKHLGEQKIKEIVPDGLGE